MQLTQEIEYPEWIRIRQPLRDKYLSVKKLLQDNSLNTVCEGANCPNRYECFSRGVATFMILGNVCTRACRYCYVETGAPAAPDYGEPMRVAEAVKTLGLGYAVITCVTRDDLTDGGAGIFADVVDEIRRLAPACKVELLISDLAGNWGALRKIVDAGPDVLAHNIETVEALFRRMRPMGDYHRSLRLLEKAKELDRRVRLKSGLMVGLGETKEQVIMTMEDLQNAGCELLTIGQYLQPSPAHVKAERFYRPDEFAELASIGKELGFEHVEAGPLVRSSYRADGYWRK